MKSLSTIFLFCAAVVLLLSSTMFAQAPANDECAGAIAVTGASLPYTNSQNTRLATPNGTDPSLTCADGGGGKTVWYTFTPDETRIYTISSRNSTPTDYDVAMGIFLGSCGLLDSLVDCNDDIIPGSVRQSEFTRYFDAGVTYIIHVAEWAGGGPSGGLPTGGDLVLEIFPDTFKSLYKGPKAGSVASGAVTNTLLFMSASSTTPSEQKTINNPLSAPKIQTNKHAVKPLGKAGSNLYGDNSTRANQTPVSQPVVLENFQGMTASGFIPPDPIAAVGPDHVITMVNSQFRIYTKNGVLQTQIDLSDWFANVRFPVGFSDPQVLYDHIEHRWIMAGGGFSEPYSLLLSVSDDDDPNGTWYNWSLPAGLGDSATGNLPDYPQMGQDDQALYITSNEFNPGLLYSRLRIIPKAQLYTGTAGAVNWFDIWDFREPDHRVVPITALRPSEIFGNPGVHFLINDPPYNPGTFFTVWTLSDATTTPSLTAQNVPVTEYYVAGNAEQLGGTTVDIEAGGSDIRHRAIYRDSSLWVAHSIANDSGSIFSAVRYVRLNPHTGVTLEDAALGEDWYWHYYPSLMVDGNKNVVITYTQSSINDYPGVYVAGRKDGDGPGLSSSVLVKAGEGHYEIVGNGRNRWGDYSGASLDPSDSLSVWVNGEYSTSGGNWATWVGQIKLSPVDGKYLYATPVTKTFDIEEVGLVSDTFVVYMKNFGTDAVSVSDISVPGPHFQLVGLPGFPHLLASGDSLDIHVLYTPQDTGTHAADVTITSDDVDRSPILVSVSGSAFHIIPAQTGQMYASSNTTDFGKVYAMSTENGSTNLIGSSGTDQIVSLRVHPTTNELMGLATSGAGFNIVRVNSDKGDAHPTVFVNYPTLKGMAFLNDSIAYVGRLNGKLYSVNINSGVTTEVGSTGLLLSGLAFNPVTGQLWATTRPVSGTLDNVYKFNLPSLIPTLVGSTGFAQVTQDILFDANGNLFGLIGSGSAQTNRLIHIDTLTGTGVLIGSAGRANLLAIAFEPGTAFDINFARFSLKKDWNMVSLPVTVDDNTTTTVFPSPTSNAFSYDGSYSSGTTLDYGAGYWLKFTAAKTHLIVGDPRETDTVAVREKWNMIGSVSSSIPVGSVIPVSPVNIVSSFMWYNPDSGYVISSTIDPGRAYWMKTDASGSVIINGTLAKANSEEQQHLMNLSTLNSLNVRDAAGRSQSLFFGHYDGKDANASRYELPPPPPAGSFDARFGSELMVAVHASDIKKGTHPLRITTGAYPVTIRWNTNGTSRSKYSLEVTDERGNHSITAMTSNGKVAIPNANTTVRLLVEENVLPTAFALRQNYPNPFNPTTSIRYELPVDAFVRLSVYDVLGREVASLVGEGQTAGVYDVQLDASQFASGIYFYKISAEPVDASKGFSGFQSVSKMMLLK